LADTKNNSVTEYSIEGSSIDSIVNRERELSRRFPLKDGTTYIQSIDKHNSMEEKDSVFSILGIGSNRNKLDPSMNTTLDELRKLWSTDYTDVIDSIDSIVESDDVPQTPIPKLLTIEGLHKIEGSYQWGKITDTLHNNQYYIIEFFTHSRTLLPLEATIYREPLEDSRIRIDIREYGRDSVMYYTHKEGFRSKRDFVRELFSLADDYQYGK
jgi:hypothetical protein